MSGNINVKDLCFSLCHLTHLYLYVCIVVRVYSTHLYLDMTVMLLTERSVYLKMVSALFWSRRPVYIKKTGLGLVIDQCHIYSYTLRLWSSTSLQFRP